MSTTELSESQQKLVRVIATNAAVAITFGLFFAYDVWLAIGNLYGIVANANQLQVALVSWGWPVLIGAIAIPVALWIAATWIGWRRPVLQKVSVQLLGLAVSAVTYLSIITMFNDSNLYNLGG